MKKYIWLIASSIMLASLPAEGRAVKSKPPAPVVESGYTEPYDFRGVKLGITLSEFKKLPPIPDRKQVNSDYPDGYADSDILTICTGDSEAKKGLMNILVTPRNGTAASGGTTCLWGYHRRPEEVMVADLGGVGKYSTHRYSFLFIKKPGDTEPVLYEIDIQLVADDVPLVSLGLRKKFGNPSTESANEVQNRMGAKFDSLSSVWENNPSKITLIQRALSVDEGVLIYQLKSYIDYVNKLRFDTAPKM